MSGAGEAAAGPVSLDAECVVAAGATLGEGPVWDGPRGVCWWVDIYGEAVHRFDRRTGDDRVLAVGDQVGALAHRTDGSLLLALAGGFATLHPETGAVTPFPSDLQLPATHRFNDGKCDAAGRFWVGTMRRDEAAGAGELVCLHAGGRVDHHLGGRSISNGLAWSADGRTLYYIDSPDQCVAAFDFEPASGALSRRRVAVAIPAGHGAPDGMTIDAEGMLWVALWGGRRVVRYHPADGRELAEVRVPADHVTSCTFGGPGLDELYITTARKGLTDEQLAGQPLAGGLFCARPGVTGLPAHPFAG